MLRILQAFLAVVFIIACVAGPFIYDLETCPGLSSANCDAIPTMVALFIGLAILGLIFHPPADKG
jgi:hypothetical protein